MTEPTLASLIAEYADALASLYMAEETGGPTQWSLTRLELERAKAALNERLIELAEEEV